jgi:hypothetical protein
MIKSFTVFFNLCLGMGVAATLSFSETQELKKGVTFQVEEDSAYIQIMTFKDKSTLIGRVTTIDDTTIEFQTTTGGVTKFAKADITGIKRVAVSAIKDGIYWYPNPQASRLLLMQTGRTLEASKFLFSDYWLFFPSLEYGLLEHFSVGSGFSIFPIFDSRVIFFTAKAGLEVYRNINIAGGIWHTIDINSSSYGGLRYGVCTLGSADNHLNFTYGEWYQEEENEGDNSVFVVGGQWRFVPGLALAGERWSNFGENTVSWLAGVRGLGDRSTFGLGIMTEYSRGNWSDRYTVPYMDFIFTF